MYSIVSQHYVYGGADTGGLIASTRVRFFEAHPTAYQANLVIQIDDISAFEIYGLIEKCYSKKLLSTLNEAGYQLFQYNDLLITVFIQKPFSFFGKQKNTINVGLIGPHKAINEAYLNLKQYIPAPSANVEWYFLSAAEVGNITVQLRHQDPPHDSFYPWINGGIKKFYSDFLKSDESILLLLGDAGTGKTSIIRDFIHRNNLSAAITHDEDLMQMDSFFITFMTSTHNLLVLEDSDILLHRREDGNSMMSKLLNTSDGLIRTNKKIILSANLTDVSSVDSALVRPGRCFGVVKFRPLTVSEASVAADVIGVARPDKPSTIAELFNGHQAIKPRHKVGF